MEHVCNIKVPQVYKGKRIALRIELNHREGHWKQDWHFEGVSVIINATEKNIEKAVDVMKNEKLVGVKIINSKLEG